MIITKIIIKFRTKKIHYLVSTTECFYMFEFLTIDSITTFIDKIDAVEGVHIIFLDHAEIITIWFL